MWSSVGVWRALGRLRALPRAAARVRTRDVTRVLGRVAAVLVALEVLYLVAGNLLLRTQAIQNAVGAADGFALEFGQAHTLWPGHVRVRDLSLRVQDYNVEFEVAIPDATLDIALSELPFKKFHVTRLAASGTRFRMRHKLIAIGDDGERVAAYPPIKGFADPPYYEGVRSPAMTDAKADHDLWKVRIENVETSLSELWMMEYRYRGKGGAKGSFVVHPTRWVQVEPAALWLDGGTLTLGSHLVAAHVRGKLSCDVPDMKVQEREGVAVLKDISGSVRLALEGGRLDFLSAYLARLGSARYAGAGDFRLDLAFVRGVIAPGSRVDVRATPLRIEHELATLSGDVMLSLRREREAELELSASAPRVVATRAAPGPSPYLEGVVGSLTLEGADLSEAIELGSYRLAVEKAHADTLAWLAPAGLELGGSADASLELSRDRKRELSGSARLRLERARLVHDELAVAGDVHGQLALFRAPAADAAIELRKLRVQLSAVTLQTGKKKSEPFGAVVDGSGLELRTGKPASATGNVRVDVSDADALLPLVMSAPLDDIASTTLSLKEELRAKTAVELSGQGLSVKLVEARSGNLRVRGYFSQHQSQARGAFLLSSGPINVGVTLSGGSTEVSPFVGDGWLASTWPRIARAGAPAKAL